MATSIRLGGTDFDLLQSMLEWSPIARHLKLLPSQLKKLPKDATQGYPFVHIFESVLIVTPCIVLTYGLFLRSMMVVSSPQIADQVCQDHDNAQA